MHEKGIWCLIMNIIYGLKKDLEEERMCYKKSMLLSFSPKDMKLKH